MKLYPNVSVFFILWFISTLTLSYLAFNLLPHSGKFTNDFVKSFANWDGGHYLAIAELGYKEKFQYAFFPLYPLFIRFLNQVLQNYLISAIVISIGSSFLAFHLLYKLIAIDFEKKIAEKVILFLLFFPTSFYFLTAYSEGLFFLLTISTFYFLQKKNLFLATVFAALASATKISGLAVVLTLLIDVKLTKGFNKKNWFVLLSPLGLIFYSWFLLYKTGDPFYFLTAENHWQRYLTIPGVSFLEAIKSLTVGSFDLNHFNVLIDLIFAIFGLGFILRSFRFLPAVYSIYGLISLIFPLFTPTLTSMPRFLAVLFPIFILMALIKNRYMSLAYQIISLMLLSLFITLFINGYWVS